MFYEFIYEFGCVKVPDVGPMCSRESRLSKIIVDIITGCGSGVAV